jgi:hypothetical protein
MAKFVQNQQTTRLLEVYKTLIKKGVVNKPLDFCSQVDYLNTSFVHVAAGRRNFPTLIINNACKVFGINPDYIFDGKLPIFVKKEDVGDDSEINLLRIRVEYLERINALLEKQLEQYQKKQKP